MCRSQKLGISVGVKGGVTLPITCKAWTMLRTRHSKFCAVDLEEQSMKSTLQGPWIQVDLHVLDDLAKHLILSLQYLQPLLHLNSFLIRGLAASFEVLNI